MEAPSHWEKLRELGSGGQSEVWLVRNSARSSSLITALGTIARGVKAPEFALSPSRAKELAEAVHTVNRPDTTDELGALKVFKIADSGANRVDATERLRNEIVALQKDIRGLPRLLDSAESGGWIVTEYFPNGTLESHLEDFKGNARTTLRAFRSLVETVLELHRQNLIHRDIKPQNVFVKNSTTLVLGDLGIVFLPGQGDRPTRTNERVGPRDYMPQWADLGVRLQEVQPNFDIYMLGKLLWCMLSGKMRLPREYHRRPEFDLTRMFRDAPDMYAINQILDHCIVEEPQKCLNSAGDLLLIVDSTLEMIERGGQIVRDDVPRLCRVCGLGTYHRQKLDQGVSGEPIVNFGMAGKNISASIYVCDSCKHVQFFAMDSIPVR